MEKHGAERGLMLRH